MDVYKRKAKAIGVEIKPSTNKTKKFDAYKDGVKQASFGGKGYMDYEKYKKQDGKAEADKKRKAYRARHKDDMNVKTRDGKLTAGYLSNKILW
tara:strand:- start:118 stop:396 length:279 start_codon:yes stop_codon:yes gene_type:complete